MLILVLNSGSSTVKYQLRLLPGSGDDSQSGVLKAGLVEKIGENVAGRGGIKDHGEALERISKELEEVLGGREVDAVGHRIVHGGEHFSTPVLITEDVVNAIERLNPLAPLHNPAGVLGIRAMATMWPDKPQVAVFDTVFHRTMPETAWRYAVPDELYRRYGSAGMVSTARPASSSRPEPRNC